MPTLHHVTTPLGSFSKGVPGSVTINFAPSGSQNCSPGCSLQRAGLCYAMSAEVRKPSITVNLERKAANLTEYLATLLRPRCREDLMAAPWVRFSAFGSAPFPWQITPVQKFLFHLLAENLDPGKTHFPVETMIKYYFYLGLGFSPRLSLGLNPNPLTIARHNDKHTRLSVTVGDPNDRKPGWTKRNIERAKEWQRKNPGSVVCPAIADNGKCGDCTSCSGASDTIVIYPLHP